MGKENFMALAVQGGAQQRVICSAWAAGCDGGHKHSNTQGQPLTSKLPIRHYYGASLSTGYYIMLNLWNNKYLCVDVLYIQVLILKCGLNVTHMLAA